MVSKLIIPPINGNKISKMFFILNSFRLNRTANHNIAFLKPEPIDTWRVICLTRTDFGEQWLFFFEGLKRQLSHQYWAGFQVDFLVFNSHYYYPQRVVPSYFRIVFQQEFRSYQGAYQRSYFISVFSHRLNTKQITI